MIKYIIIICLFLNGCTAYKHNQLQKEIIKKQQSWLNIQYLAMKKPQLTNKKGTMKKYKLIDTSQQIIYYECTVEANSEKEAIAKADNWEQYGSECIDNEIEAIEINN